MSRTKGFCPAHNVFQFSNGVIFSSNFDNGNLADVEEGNKNNEYHIWTSPDAAPRDSTSGSQSKNNAWFHFCITGLAPGSTVKIVVQNASSHGGLYKHDMRPVFRCKSSGNRWGRIRAPVKYEKREGDHPRLAWEHQLQDVDDKIYFCFTYPYTYSMVQEDLNAMNGYQNQLNDPNALYWHRELLTGTRDGNRVDLVTISSCNGIDMDEKEPLFDSIFPEAKSDGSSRPQAFPEKQILWISGRVHPGEVPAQHTIKGIFKLLLDEGNVISQELRRRYVFKIVPMINPDGVIRGHFRMDQFGQNLNRYYGTPDKDLQGPIFAIKKLLDHYAERQKLALYLDCHAHASKRGCFIYGNVLDTIDDQVQNMLYCRLVALNTPHFDYEGCLFSREHMSRIDPGDRGAGLTAEGSGRVSSYLHYQIVHSYTLECNYNSSKSGNEVPGCEHDPLGESGNNQPPSSFTTYPEKYTPASWQGVGRACIIAMLDLRGHNPCGRIPCSKAKTLSRYRHSVAQEVRQRKEYKEQRGRIGAAGASSGYGNASGTGAGGGVGQASAEQPSLWRRCISSAPPDTTTSGVTEGGPTMIDWGSLQPRTGGNSKGEGSRGGQLGKGTETSNMKSFSRTNSSSRGSGGGEVVDSASRLSAQRYEQSYERRSAGGKGRAGSGSRERQSQPGRGQWGEREEDGHQPLIPSSISAGQQQESKERLEKATVGGQISNNNATSRAVNSYLAPTNIDMIPDSGAAAASNSARRLQRGSAGGSQSLLPRAPASGSGTALNSLDELSIGGSSTNANNTAGGAGGVIPPVLHASSGSGGANGRAGATPAAAAGTIKLDFGVNGAPKSPSNKTRRSNKGPRSSPSKLSKDALSGGGGGGGGGRVKKGHPLTAAYAANSNSSGGGGGGAFGKNSKLAAALKVPGSSRGILSRNLTSSGVLKLSKADPTGILQSPAGGRGRKAGGAGGAGGLPPAQPMDRSNGYYSGASGTGPSSPAALPPPRSGGNDVMAEIKRVLASEAGVDSSTLTGAGGKALKSNIPRLSRLDASSIKNGHLLL